MDETKVEKNTVYTTGDEIVCHVFHWVIGQLILDVKTRLFDLFYYFLLISKLKPSKCDSGTSATDSV